MNIDYVKKLIIELGFAPQDGKSGVFVKHYLADNSYPIFINFNEQKIIYAHPDIQQDKRIRLGDLTTSNFEKPENFVVLECIDRLLSKGYRPENLELEKKYPLGRTLKGKLDILVYEDNNFPFLMIECKTWGSEFEKESAKTLNDGGQIFSYYQQDRVARFLCVYSSHFDKEKVEYRSNIILIEKSWRALSSAKDIHEYWNKNFKDNGIFETYVTPYDVKPKALTYGMLKNLKEEDSGKIYNQIMEILRHNAISDKPNAFNKLLNLFVCKIIDEDKNPVDELMFQCFEDDTDESLQMRLNDLYKNGMWDFLAIEVIDHSEKDVAKALEGIDNLTQKKLLMDMFRDTRLKKSPNFAFVEVLDEKTFKLNAKIVREIVELLQVYKFRYEQKHEFLGNFFELLLNTSMKQEAGQFFTPVPITRFIISSLPLKEFVQKRIDDKERNVLPAVMDYACGSGHFLTEYMDQMQSVIDSKIDVSAALPNVRNMIQSWQGLTKFLWAKDSVYGIDLDNRLVKTTKVSAFFNGDGEANIIWANGLDNFEKTEEYRDLLRQTQPYDRKNNGQFDILISNPPYSVEAFKSTLKYGDETFELYKNITDNSSEIECFFVERMKQLLRVGGWVGIILPSSILSNGGIHSKAREILFKYFKVKAIVELGSGTFMKTGTNTVVLFLERRSDNDFMLIGKAIEVFVANLKDVTVLGIENAFSKYVASAYDDLSFNDYLTFLTGKANVAMQTHELYSDYKKAFTNDAYAKGISLEKEKMLYFLLTYTQNIVLIKTGQKQEEKNFLGYEFSERRGHEGIKRLPNGTKLYDESGYSLNPKKANSYIYNAFLGKMVNIDDDLAQNISYGRMSGFVNYGLSKFDKIVNLNKKFKFETSIPLRTLASISKLIKRGKSASYGDSNIQIIKSGQARGFTDFDFTERHYVSDDFVSDERNLIKGDILINSTGVGTAGRVTLFDLDGSYVVDSHITIIRLDEERVLPKYVLFALAKIGFKNIEAMANGQSGQIELSLETIAGIKIPFPTLDVQQKIVVEIEEIEHKEKELEGCLKISQEKIDDIVNTFFARSYPTEQIGNVTKIYNGGTPNTKKRDYWNGNINWATLVDTKNKYIYATQRMITEKGLNSCNATLLPINTVLFSSRATIGDVSITKVPMSTNQGYKNFVCDDNKLHYEYLYYVLKHEAKTIGALANGMTYPEISKSLISTYKIPLPSFSEQESIIAEIKKIEIVIGATQTKLAEFKNKKKDVLQKYL